MTREDILELVELNGFTLIRQNKHLVYRDVTGRNFVMSSTPSDWRAEHKNYHYLKKIVQASGRTFIETKPKKEKQMADHFNPPKMVVHSKDLLPRPQYTNGGNQSSATFKEPDINNKEQLFAVIRALNEDGKTYKQIAELLNARGLVPANIIGHLRTINTQMFDAPTISAFCISMGHRKFQKHTRDESQENEPEDSSKVCKAFVDKVFNSQLPDDKKLAIIKILMN